MFRQVVLLILISAAMNCLAETLIFSCKSCHGHEFEGRAAIRAPALAGQPAIYLEYQLKLYRDGLRGAGFSDKYGQQMALMASNLSDDHISMLASEISKLHPVMSEVEPIEDSRYATCATCHGIRGEGNKDMQAPYLAGLDADYLEVQMEHFRDKVRGYDARDQNGRLMAESMPPEFTNEDIRALARLLSSADGFQ